VTFKEADASHTDWDKNTLY